MRLRHKMGSEEDIKSSPICIQNKEDITVFIKNRQILNSNKVKLCLELGMGKGQFICKNAFMNPNNIYIGVEKYATVVLKAIKNYNKFLLNDSFNDNSLLNTNLRFLCEDVLNLEKYFDYKTVDIIYLNFSDPWPKKRHENRRITHHNFLSIYEKLLKKTGILEFKTDNKNLFDFSIEEIKKSNFKLLDFTYDLHNDNKLNFGNIMTEYEEKFSKKGNPICKLIATI